MPHTHTHTHSHTLTFTLTNTLTHIHTHTRARTQSHARTITHTLTHTFTHTLSHTLTHTHTPTHTLTNTHTHTHTNTEIQKHREAKDSAVFLVHCCFLYHSWHDAIAVLASNCSTISEDTWGSGRGPTWRNLSVRELQFGGSLFGLRLEPRTSQTCINYDVTPLTRDTKLRDVDLWHRPKAINFLNVS